MNQDTVTDCCTGTSPCPPKAESTPMPGIRNGRDGRYLPHMDNFRDVIEAVEVGNGQ